MILDEDNLEKLNTPFGEIVIMIDGQPITTWFIEPAYAGMNQLEDDIILGLSDKKRASEPMWCRRHFLHLDFCAVLESEANVVFGIDRDKIDHAVPKFIGKLRDGIQFGEFRKELLDHLFVSLFLGNRLFHFFEASFGAVKPLCKAVVAFLVIILILRHTGILGDAFFNLLGDHVHFSLQACPLLQKSRGIENRVLDGFKICNQGILICDDDVHRFNEKLFDFCLRDVGRPAFAVFIEFVVALPDDLFVLIVGVPNL